ncbi:serine-repeat antigen [Plasmodium brasilianum]|uniref:Serine-repeat antigen n=1 Tax=Plasmodium brasilianum TaxID=5824 RepID=A0ACB9YDN4_PLABR|nr:serine-repeat antigen [Plasmodium brasilianum]
MNIVCAYFTGAHSFSTFAFVVITTATDATTTDAATTDAATTDAATTKAATSDSATSDSATSDTAITDTAYVAVFKSRVLVNCFGLLHCKICHTIIRNCFLSGTSDLSKCIACEESYYSIKPCTHHTDEYLMDQKSKGAFVELQDHEYLSDEKMAILLSEIIKISIDRHKKGVAGGSTLDNDLKKKIMQLCLYSNFNDNYENAKSHTQATPEEVEEHIQKIIDIYIKETNNMEHILNSLKNPALCLKDPTQWVKDRAGYKDIDSPSAGIISEKKLFKPYKIKSLMSSLYSSKSNCTMQFCNRFADSNECESKIRVLNQGTCGNCWAFASSTTISAFRCRKGLGFAEPSAKYVTLCKNKHINTDDGYVSGHYNDNICREGGHLSYYLETLDNTKMLPTSHNVPYNEPIKGADCPDSKPSWSNMWDEVNSVDRIFNGYIFSGYFKLSFGEYVRNGMTKDLIKIIKEYIIEQGALFVSMKVNGKLSFDHDGEKVMMNCEYEESPDHALVLIGYGDYIKPSGEESSYWLIRNSWGSHWGDKGNFKIDMYGPSNCNGQVLCNAFPLLLQMRGKKIDNPLPNDLASTDTRMRYNHSSFDMSRRRKYPEQRDNQINDDRMNPNNPYDNDRYDKNRIDNDRNDNNPFVNPRYEDMYDEHNEDRYGPNYQPFNDRNAENEYSPEEAGADYPGIGDNRKNSTFRRTFLTNLVVNIGNTQYKRTIYSRRKDEYKEKFSCLRTFSMDESSDVLCRDNCERHIDMCKYNASIGECLMKFSSNYKCIYCGM